jgi:hypothetical protein
MQIIKSIALTIAVASAIGTAFAADTTASRLPFKLPKVEIFADQLPIIIRPGEFKTVTLTGAVYDTSFNGRITLDPNGPKETACPIFFSLPGVPTPVSAPVGPDSVKVQVGLRGPVGVAAGDYTCALKYTAIHSIFNVGDFSVGKGNEVRVRYTLKRR